MPSSTILFHISVLLVTRHALAVNEFWARAVISIGWSQLPGNGRVIGPVPFSLQGWFQHFEQWPVEMVDCFSIFFYFYFDDCTHSYAIYQNMCPKLDYNKSSFGQEIRKYNNFLLKRFKKIFSLLMYVLQQVVTSLFLQTLGTTHNSVLCFDNIA